MRYPQPGRGYVYGERPRRETPRWIVLAVLIVIAGIVFSQPTNSQQQQSGGGGSSVTVTGSLPAGGNVIGKVGIDQTTPGTTNLVSIGSTGTVGLVAGSAVIGHVINDASAAVIGHVIADTGSTTAVTSLSALVNGTANIGFVRAVPSACTQSTTFTSATVGVATGAGTSVTSTTTCVTAVYVNNITNSAVTFRLADKTGTPIIWIGGNADYSVPANSNVQFPVNGVLFTAGITAIAGTGSALNLFVAGLQ
jgi:hypothetical protein